MSGGWGDILTTSILAFLLLPLMLQPYQMLLPSLWLQPRTRRETLKCLGNTCSHLVVCLHLCSLSLHKPLYWFGSFEAEFLQLQVLMCKTGVRRSSLLPMFSGAQEEESLLSATLDFKNWNRSGNLITTRFFFHTVFSFLS